MPGYRRPQTTAFGPDELRGFSALEKAFAEYRPLNHGSLRRKRSVEAMRQSVPAKFVHIPSSDEENSSGGDSDQSPERDGEAMGAHRLAPTHEPVTGSLRPARRLVTPPQLTRLTSTLPPTPPTMTNSDDNEPRAGNLATDVQFADAVRDILEKDRAGLRTPGGHLPTPEPSPPGTSEDLTAPTLRPMLLHPLSAHHLRQYPSSRADSFHTAREEPMRSQQNLLTTPSPEPQQSDESWLDAARRTPLPRSTSSQHSDDSPSPPQTVPMSPRCQAVPPYLYATPSYSRRARRSESPYRSQGSDLDLEKHISYISHEGEEAEPYFMPQDDVELDAMTDPPEFDDTSTRDSGAPDASTWPHKSHDPSAEDVNNLVYKQIQEENLKRHSLPVPHEALRNFSGGCGGSGRESPDIIPKPLRPRKAMAVGRQPDSSPASSPTAHHTLRHAKGAMRELEASPELESPQEQRVLPRSAAARLGDSPITRLTAAALAGDREPQTDLRRGHTLRHVSNEKRIENSLPSRRTRAESGTAQDPASMGSPTRSPARMRRLRRSSREVQVENLNHATVRRTMSPPIPEYLPEELHPGMEPEGAVRHFSNDAKVSNTSHVRHASLEVPPTTGPTRTIRHFDKEAKLENNSHVRRTSLDMHSGFPPRSSRKNSLDMNSNSGFVPGSPRKSSWDARLLHPLTTPMSTSQFSDQTTMELCEAKGVELFPHTNHSLLVVQTGPSHTSREVARVTSPDNYLGLTDRQLGIGMPLFATHIQEPVPITAPLQHPSFSAHLQEPSPVTGPRHPHFDVEIDSPLTHPRAAPVPPALQIIPPTPCSELDRQLALDDEEYTPTRPTAPQRRQSLLQRARRFSESFIGPSMPILFRRGGSLRRHTRRENEMMEARPQTLSPFWQPRGFWDGYDSEDDDDDADDYEDLGPMARTRLPAGGDTSGFESSPRRGGLLGRSLSLRLPSMRRAPRGDRVVKKRSSSGGLHTGSQGSAYVSQGSPVLRSRPSEEMLKQMVGGGAGGPGRVFTLPFSGGRRVQYVGVGRFRERIARGRAEREERERERRRGELRGQISHGGPRVER
ncbi:hypothetical protein LTR53_016628 [Teratosphaeriaceae sp. CCFEE 6253]|nr:hypothetical protein LTR53_016628 [Teratosphaeriaceae sp. CCFEE 6253]